MVRELTPVNLGSVRTSRKNDCRVKVKLRCLVMRLTCEALNWHLVATPATVATITACISLEGLRCCEPRACC